MNQIDFIPQFADGKGFVTNVSVKSYECFSIPASLILKSSLHDLDLDEWPSL